VLDTSAPADPVVHLLPGFEEYVLGVKDRSGIVPHGGMERLVPGGNGIFRPTILVDGLIRGTWRMRPDRKGVPLEWFTEPGHHEARGAHRAAQRYLDYLAG
jgi:hypothetical protein